MINSETPFDAKAVSLQGEQEVLQQRSQLTLDPTESAKRQEKQEFAAGYASKSHLKVW